MSENSKYMLFEPSLIAPGEELLMLLKRSLEYLSLLQYYTQ
jgi:hypothetical protein